MYLKAVSICTFYKVPTREIFVLFFDISRIIFTDPAKCASDNRSATRLLTMLNGFKVYFTHTYVTQIPFTY